jgi:riboflavin synthase
MFTGLVEGTGVVRDLRGEGGPRRIVIEAGPWCDGLRDGESIAVNGVCLTAVSVRGKVFEADLSPETLERTTLGRLRRGALVNLERALPVGGRLGGHLVQGHVDGVGRVLARWSEGDAVWMEVAAPPGVARYLVEKGSVAVDGVSLTVARVGPGRFTVCLIPHTCASTTLGNLEAGGEVNVEADVVAKYVERVATPYVHAGGAEEGPSVAPSEKADE